MARVIVTPRQGEERIVEAAAGHSLMEELRSGGIVEVSDALDGLRVTVAPES